MVLIKLPPTWRNRVAKKGIAKRLKIFLINERLISSIVRYGSYSLTRSDSDHLPIYLQLEGYDLNPLGPLKFNPHWLYEEQFVHIVRREWACHDLDKEETTIFQF
jgi:hypothetical protein